MFLSHLMCPSRAKVCVDFICGEITLSLLTESVGSTPSSKLTSSDKLSALPSTSSPALGRIRTPTPAIRRNLDPTNSLPPSPPLGSMDLPPIGSHSLSEGSLGIETTKQRVSFDSDRGSLPSFQNVKQGERVFFKP